MSIVTSGNQAYLKKNYCSKCLEEIPSSNIYNIFRYVLKFLENKKKTHTEASDMLRNNIPLILLIQWYMVPVLMSMHSEKQTLIAL